MTDLIKCVVYECLLNEGGKCTNNEHEISPNTLNCKKIQNIPTKHHPTNDIIEERLTVSRLREFAKSGLDAI